jgi:prepilin peptidase CpaA
MGEVFSLHNSIVLIVLAAAVVSDIKTKRVDNRFVLGAFAIGTLFQVMTAGSPGLWALGSSVLTAIVLGLPLYLMRIFAGGDFKLLVAISTLLDWKTMITVILSSLVWGAVLGLFQTIIQGNLKVVFNNLIAIFLNILSRKKPQLTQLHAMPFTVAILLGFLSHLTLSQVGWELL